VLELTISIWLVVGLACFLTGLSKGGLGGSLGAVITPLLSLVMPVEIAIGLFLPFLMVGDVFTMAAHWRRWDWKLARRLLAGALVGVGLGTIFIAQVSPVGLRHTLGVFILLFALYRLFEPYLLKKLHNQSSSPGEGKPVSRFDPYLWLGLLAGLLAGFTSTIASAGSPPVIIYLLMLNLPPATFVATSALFFTIINWVKIPSYFSAGILHLDLTLRLAWLLPLIPSGVWVGKHLVHRINRSAFERLVVGFLLISSFLLLFR
jgi:uncharacterized membrane protein YfcA